MTEDPIGGALLSAAGAQGAKLIDWRWQGEGLCVRLTRTGGLDPCKFRAEAAWRYRLSARGSIPPSQVRSFVTMDIRVE